MKVVCRSMMSCLSLDFNRLTRKKSVGLVAFLFLLRFEMALPFMVIETISASTSIVTINIAWRSLILWLMKHQFYHLGKSKIFHETRMDRLWNAALPSPPSTFCCVRERLLTVRSLGLTNGHYEWTPFSRMKFIHIKVHINVTFAFKEKPTVISPSRKAQSL